MRYHTHLADASFRTTAITTTTTTTAPRPANATRGARGRGRGRGGKRSGGSRPANKSAADLDAEMEDYFKASLGRSFGYTSHSNVVPGG